MPEKCPPCSAPTRGSRRGLCKPNGPCAGWCIWIPASQGEWTAAGAEDGLLRREEFGMGFYLQIEVDTTPSTVEFRERVIVPLGQALEREQLGRVLDDGLGDEPRSKGHFE